MAVHLIRNASTPRRTARRTDGALPRGKLRAVVEYVEEHLAGLTLEQIAAVAHLSPYHFARQFKEATGLPPHQYVIARRVWVNLGPGLARLLFTFVPGGIDDFFSEIGRTPHDGWSNLGRRYGTWIAD